MSDLNKSGEIDRESFFVEGEWRLPLAIDESDKEARRAWLSFKILGIDTRKDASRVGTGLESRIFDEIQRAHYN